MSEATQEIIRLCEALPDHKRAEVVDFARFLLSQAESGDDVAWEARIARPLARPKLAEFLHQAAAEGDEALDPGRL